MISKKYLGLFAIICTIGISSPGLIDVQASSEMDYNTWKLCMLLYSPIGDWVCGAEPDKPKCYGYFPGTTMCIDREKP